MSIFNDQAASSALAARLSGAPGAGPDDFGASVAGGIGTALFSIPGSIAVRAGAALPLAFEPIRPTLEGVDGILGTNAAEWLTSWQEAGRRTVARALPRPWELGTAGGLVYGLGVQLPELIAAYHAGGPGLAAVYSGALAKMQRSIELEREGVARDFADQTSDIAGAVMGVSALLPGSFAFGRTAAMRAGTDIAGQAGVNVAAGVAQRSAERGALMPGYPDVAARIEPLGLTEILFDGLLGGGLAAGVHGIAAAARPARDIVRDLSTRTADEVLANRGVQHSHVDVRPGEPRTHVDAEAHIEALVRATEQMARGEQVNVAGIVDMAGFEPIATDPVGAALDGARLEAVRQAEREHAESMGYTGIEEMAPAAEAPQDAPAARPAKRWTATIATKTGRFANPELELPGETVGPLEYERRARAVFMARLRAAGGIELPEAIDIAGERANKLPPGLFHRGGRSIDHHVEWMVEAGYVSRDEVDADVGGGVWRARDLIRQALDGRPVYTPEQAMRVAELEAADDATPDAETAAERAAIKAEGGITEADLEAAGYFDLSPRDQVDVDAWLAYADELGISHEDIDAALDGLSSPGGRQAGEDASRSFAEVEGPDRGDDPPGESAQAGAARIRGGDREGGEVGEPGGGKYSQDVFGAPLPDGAGADSRGAAEPGGPPAGADDVHAAGPVRDPAQVDANTFAATTFARTIGTVAIGVERVTGPEEAAHVFAHLRKFPVEHIAVLTVDAQDRPLALTSIAIGERASTAYDTHAIVGAALRDPRAVGIWVAHNHPSKTDELSSADRTASIALDALAGSIGVRYHGFLAIAGARFAAVQPGASAFSGDITPRARSRTVPLQERAFRRNGVLIDKDVDSPVAAIAIGTKVAAGRTGVVLLNHKHLPVAWLTLDAATMTGEGAAGARRSFMSALEASNASAALYVHQGALADVDARAVDALVSNARLAQVRVLDVVSVRDRTTKESGGVPLSRPGAAEPGDMLTRYTNDDILEREQEHMAAAGVDNAKQAEWKRKAEADAQRDAFALTGSDREADVAASRGQRALFEPGAEYRDPQDEPVSQRNPTAAKATENPITTRLSVGLASFSADAAAFAHNVGLMARYPNFLRLGVRDPAKRAEAMIRHIVDNLLWLHDSVPAEIRARSRLWYDGAHQIAGQFGEQFGVSRRASAGVIAVMSPQRDWFMNVSLARRVLDVVANRRDFAWSSEMNAASEALRRIDPGVADLIVGKKFSELTGPVARALWIRVYDKAHNSASFDALAPEGDSLGPKKTKSGADAEVQWGSLPTIIKALSIIDDDSRANISAQLGAAHKVRNFYNNIIDPNGADGSVTIDTHAVAAALLRPLSAASREVSHALGGGLAGEVGTKNSSISGSSGTYGLYAEAYRRAARERGLLPRELQSITWEASRGLFSPSSKRNQGALDAAAEAWQNHARGKIDAAGARDDILKAVSGIDEPSWASTPAVRRGDGGGDARAVPGADVLAGADAGPAAPGSAGGRPARVADLTSQDVRDYPGSIDAPIPRDAVLAAADARVAEAEASADLATQAAISCALTVGG